MIPGSTAAATVDEVVLYLQLFHFLLAVFLLLSDLGLKCFVPGPQGIQLMLFALDLSFFLNKIILMDFKKSIKVYLKSNFPFNTYIFFSTCYFLSNAAHFAYMSCRLIGQIFKLGFIP